ncbi:hypothetical protein F5B21DRAFT_489708 [Xylaria acuta]|nr:hypothetical protein F5B21DRAFT_489708 [Xylaria acuta]
MLTLRVRLLYPLWACEHAFDLEGALHNHTSSSHAGQHLIISKSPFVCHCGQHFTRLCSLERHVRDNTEQPDPEYQCAECPAYQGKDGFKRKDHLVQHLRVFHKWDDDRLATLFPPRQTHRLKIPVCHFPECDHYRGPDFKDKGIREQEKNRPFDKQSHYTDHMKREHDWSPYPCKVTGCSKVNGTGFFTTTTFERHYKKMHPGSAIPTPKVQDITETVKCDHCQQSFSRGRIASHQDSFCKGVAVCCYCHGSMENWRMRDHQRNDCQGEVACHYCHERLEKWQMRDHQQRDCRGEFTCHYCHKRMESRQLTEHSEIYHEPKEICFRCLKRIEWGSFFCWECQSWY